jgi:hypothetical protein
MPTSGWSAFRGTTDPPIVVQARLNGRVTARLTLDTGADVSVIKPELLRAAGVDLSRPATSGSASGITGQAQADFYQVTLAVEGRSLAALGCGDQHGRARLRRSTRP